MGKWNRRMKRIILPAIFGVVMIGLVVYGVWNDSEKTFYKRQLAAVYQKSFQDTVTDVGSLETKLDKLQVANSDGMFSLLLTDVWRQTGQTGSSISSLPISVTQAEPLTQFINRLGDYCRYLSQKIGNGQKLDDSDYAQLRSLRSTCTEISKRLNDVWSQGYVPPSEMQKAAFYVDTVKTPSQGNSQNLDFTGQEYPKLQYDGPFSESTETRQPKGLTGADYSADQAKAAAIAFLGQGYVQQLNQTEDLNSTITAYGFTGKTADGDITVYVTKKGGHVLYWMTNTLSTVQAVPTDERYEELTQVAIQYFKSKGFPDMKPSYAQFYNGMAVINLAPVEKDAVLYPDLVKAWVDIEKNTVLGIDTRNYLMNHTQRNYPQVKVNQEEAKKKVTSRLAVESARLALIPTGEMKEVLCWEFKGKVDGTDYFIYINAETGKEEDILQIRHTNNGTLVV
jgi:spore germination protein